MTDPLILMFHRHAEIGPSWEVVAQCSLGLYPWIGRDVLAKCECGDADCARGVPEIIADYAEALRIAAEELLAESVRLGSVREILAGPHVHSEDGNSVGRVP